MSGSAYSDWATSDETTKNTNKIIEVLKCPKSDDPYKYLQLITQCLRNASMEDIMSVHVEASMFKSAFGPTVDGITINKDNMEDATKIRKKLSGYDIIFGVTGSESSVLFSDDDLISGISEDKRDHLLWSYIKNVNHFHNKEIFASVVSEYTEWNKPLQHPINMRDNTVMALTDGQYVAPILKLAQFMPENVYMYVFHHKAKSSQRYQVRSIIYSLVSSSPV